MVITLDGICIFRGEIAQACGSIMGGMESFGDVRNVYCYTLAMITNLQIIMNVELLRTSI